MLAEAQHLVETSGEGAHAAEICRLQGEFLLAQACAPHHALDIARSQQAKALELRAAMSLSRLVSISKSTSNL
jgi:hypothetical protein